MDANRMQTLVEKAIAMTISPTRKSSSFNRYRVEFNVYNFGVDIQICYAVFDPSWIDDKECILAVYFDVVLDDTGEYRFSCEIVKNDSDEIVIAKSRPFKNVKELKAVFQFDRTINDDSQADADEEIITMIKKLFA